jgi:hypothetical protein
MSATIRYLCHVCQVHELFVKSSLILDLPTFLTIISLVMMCIDIEPGVPEGYMWFDLPLNGYWSDLTATLELLMVDQQLVFELTAIEGM